MLSEKTARPDFRKAIADTADTWLMSVVKTDSSGLERCWDTHYKKGYRARHRLTFS